MSTSARLRATDFRSLFQLTGECRDLGDDAVAWQQHLFATLGRMTDAELVIGGEVMSHEETPTSVGYVDWGWENGLDRNGFLESVAEVGDDLSSAGLMMAYFQRVGLAGGSCLGRQELLGDDEWYPTPYFQKIHRAMGVDHSIMAFRAIPGDGGHCSGFSVMRASGRAKDFTGRHRLLIEEAQLLITPLIGGPLARFSDPSPRDLAPRVRQVLACLLEGDSDKQVGVRLKLSIYTVNQYTKTIYAHFGVTSRPELLARWVRRAWGRRPWE